MARLEPHHNAETLRALRQDHPFHMGFLLLQQGRRAKQCGCGHISCAACGLMRLYQRTRRIANAKHPITTGYLTGGPQNQAMR